MAGITEHSSPLDAMQHGRKQSSLGPLELSLEPWKGHDLSNSHHVSLPSFLQWQNGVESVSLGDMLSFRDMLRLQQRKFFISWWSESKELWRKRPEIRYSLQEMYQSMKYFLQIGSLSFYHLFL